MKSARFDATQVNYGVLTDERGCPVSVSVFEGNTGDRKTLLPQVEKSRKNFGIDRLVMVGDAVDGSAYAA